MPTSSLPDSRMAPPAKQPPGHPGLPQDAAASPRLGQTLTGLAGLSWVVRRVHADCENPADYVVELIEEDHFHAGRLELAFRLDAAQFHDFCRSQRITPQLQR